MIDIRQAFYYRSKLERMRQTDIFDVCIDLPSIGQVWISGDRFVAADSDMFSFLIDCDFSQGDAQIISNLDWSVVAADGVGAFCFNGTIFDWNLYEHLGQQEDSNITQDVMAAAKTLGLDMFKLEDLYLGKWDSFRDFVEERWDEMNLHQIPEEFHNYINYDKIAAEWQHDYNHENGYVFG